MVNLKHTAPNRVSCMDPLMLAFVRGQRLKVHLLKNTQHTHSISSFLILVEVQHLTSGHHIALGPVLPVREEQQH